MGQAESETTTIEVKVDTWAALDRRKGRGESFDDVVRKLINATPAGVGDLSGPAPDIDYGKPELIDDPEGLGEGCSHFDVIAGEPCHNPVMYRQEYQYADVEDTTTRVFYYCDDHVPDLDQWEDE